jgi:eukaryotic-like serine/threonine-protein kinase
VTPERWRRITEVFHAALARDAAMRMAFLDEACAGDETLRQEVASMLAAHGDAEGVDDGSLLDAAPAADVFVPRELSHYQILEKIGEGGMGAVYRARDKRLGRTVAVKVLNPEALARPDHRQRFAREARAASALNHPNIVVIHDVGSELGVDFIAMEYVDGEPLDCRLARQLPSMDEVLRYARGIAEALTAAHQAGIVHRDIKPSNVVVSRTGQLKVLDFGLAKLVTSPTVDCESPTLSATPNTEHGIVLGTRAYMSPEQIEGKRVDARSDVFSFGVTLFELLCGQRPFQGASAAALAGAILREPPSPPRALRPDTPAELEVIILRCLEKDPARRYASGTELCDGLRQCEARLAAAGRIARVIRHRPALAVAVIVSLLTVSATGIALAIRAARARWARDEALPEVARLTETGRYLDAYRLAHAAQKLLPDDRGLQEAINKVTMPVSINTEPPGAQVFYKGYLAEDDPWELVGTSPLEHVRIPYALPRWSIVKDGYERYEGTLFANTIQVTLDRVGSRPDGMVRVAGGRIIRPPMPAADLDEYWLDRYEVTNREFKRFVDAGGYDRREYWAVAFAEDGEALSWADAESRFRDATGRPGPATWKRSTYAAGQDEFPVNGVSWYEAAAYCAFAGKTLPSVYHWFKASQLANFSDVIRLSNFGTAGARPVGMRQAIGTYGNYDMAGNVKEWCWNVTAGKRYLLGGAWNEAAYMARALDARSPLDRSPTNGFRCVRYPKPVPAALVTKPIVTRDLKAEKPVSDAVFQSFRSIYSYGRSELAPSTDATDEASRYWRREKVSFSAAYGDERVIAWLFLPRNTAPPYQTVVWYPGDDAFFFGPNDDLGSPFMYDFIPRSGRAFVYPIYKGMYERRTTPFTLQRTPEEWRDRVILWSKDLGRTMDYLETRADIDRDRIAYYGFSGGAMYGPIFTAIDPRFKASVLVAGGIPWMNVPPEMSVINFAPRSRVPTLMINGRDDFVFPAESSQRVLFDLLGAPDSQKRHVLLASGHQPPRPEMIKETLDWLDQRLGPVRIR